eukprot:375736_1
MRISHVWNENKYFIGLFIMGYGCIFLTLFMFFLPVLHAKNDIDHYYEYGIKSSCTIIDISMEACQVGKSTSTRYIYSALSVDECGNGITLKSEHTGCGTEVDKTIGMIYDCIINSCDEKTFMFDEPLKDSKEYSQLRYGLILWSVCLAVFGLMALGATCCCVYVVGDIIGYIRLRQRRGDTEPEHKDKETYHHENQTINYNMTTSEQARPMAFRCRSCEKYNDWDRPNA